MQSQKQQNDLCCFQGKPFNITVIQVYALTNNAEEAEVERFYEDLQDLLELKPKRDVLFSFAFRFSTFHSFSTFHTVCKTSSDNHFAFLHFFFLGMVLITASCTMSEPGIWSHRFMGNRWETIETVTEFILGGSQITADGDCTHEIKRHLLLGRKVITNLDSILRSRDITLPTKVLLVKAMVFPVVMYGCESWTIKKAEHRRIDASELWCWRRLLRVPWTARRSNQSILKEISPEYSLEGLMLKLKLQYSGHLMQRTDSLEKTLRLEKIEGGRRG